MPLQGKILTEVNLLLYKPPKTIHASTIQSSSCSESRVYILLLPFLIIRPDQEYLLAGIVFFFLLISLFVWIHLLYQRIKLEKILNYFATSLYGQNTVDDIFWDVAKNCISKLKFRDCVIYQYNEERKLLLQKAAYGPKNPEKHEILNPIEIPIGQGIVGAVAKTGKAEIIADTSKDARYIVDDLRRYSEVTVPIFVDGKLFGVIDSEHPRKRFFNKNHLLLLEKIALICSAKISKYLVEDKLRMKIARDLHDEIGSTLTSINIISKLTMQQSEANGMVKSNLKKIKEYSSKMMESMSDIVWAINPANDTMDKILIRMKELAAEVLEPAKVNYFFHEEGSLENLKLNVGQRKDLYLIFKEALNNAVKYSEASEVHISLKQKDNRLQLRVTDNGKGFDLNSARSGNGLKNMRSRAEDMRAVLQIESIPESGTTVSMEVDIL
jgi:signal transduction histidine kinase